MVNVNETNLDGTAGLHQAFKGGHCAVAELLLDRGAEVSRTARNGVAALHIALNNKDMETTRLLLERGAETYLSSPSWSALLVALSARFSEAVQLLLDNGADVNVTFRSSTRSQMMTGLQVACENGDVDSARILLAHGAALVDIDERWSPAITSLLREFEESRARPPPPPPREEKKLRRRVCDVCGKHGPIDELCFPVCDNCSSRRYCGLECQRVDWFERGHREACAGMVDSRDWYGDAGAYDAPD